jgi:toxin FitB
MAKARSARLSIATADGYIAAIAVANGFAVAIGDISPFEDANVRMINLWAM